MMIITPTIAASDRDVGCSSFFGDLAGLTARSPRSYEQTASEDSRSEADLLTSALARAQFSSRAGPAAAPGLREGRAQAEENEPNWSAAEHQPNTVTGFLAPRCPRESRTFACRQGLEGLAGTGCPPRSTLVMKGSAVRIRASASREPCLRGVFLLRETFRLPEGATDGATRACCQCRARRSSTPEVAVRATARQCLDPPAQALVIAIWHLPDGDTERFGSCMARSPVTRQTKFVPPYAARASQVSRISMSGGAGGRRRASGSRSTVPKTVRSTPSHTGLLSPSLSTCRPVRRRSRLTGAYILFTLSRGSDLACKVTIVASEGIELTLTSKLESVIWITGPLQRCSRSSIGPTA